MHRQLTFLDLASRPLAGHFSAQNPNYHSPAAFVQTPHVCRLLSGRNSQSSSSRRLALISSTSYIACKHAVFGFNGFTAGGIKAPLRIYTYTALRLCCRGFKRHKNRKIRQFFGFNRFGACSSKTPMQRKSARERRKISYDNIK